MELSSNDQELIVALRDGNQHALKTVFDQYAGKLHHYSLKICKSSTLAEDVVQDVFVKLWEKREVINIERSLQSYLFRIARNQLLNLIKRAEKENEILKEMICHQSAVRDSVNQEIGYQESQKLIDQAIDNLPTERQLIFKLSREEEMTYAEIADAMGIAKGTVNVQMVKALKSIRDYLALSEVATIFCFLHIDIFK